jgi:hypothetical protein
MIPPLDPFALNFDSIEIDPARAPSPAAIAAALEIAAPDGPGFYLIDDAGGRFVVEREMGVVSLADDALLERERGAVHLARLRVVEPSGASYELAMRLRLTGRVPQMVGAEEFADIAGVAVEPAPEPAAAPLPRVAWTSFAAARGAFARPALGEETAPYGVLLCAELPAVKLPPAALALAADPPAPASAAAAWAI